MDQAGRAVRATPRTRRPAAASHVRAGPHAAAAPAQAREGCTLSDLFRLLGERHVPDVLHRILQEPSVRFNTIQQDLGMSPNTLSDRLKKLQQAGLVTRHAYNEIPPRVEYAATSKARELGNVFETLDTWAQQHTLRPE